MNPLKENLRAALNFTASEKRALFILILIMFVIAFSPYILDEMNEEDEMLIEVSRLEYVKHLEKTEKVLDKTNNFFSDFDPNSISKSDLKKMPIPEYIADRMVKYRKSGGVFYKKEDVKKIYGVTDDLYVAMEPYLFIRNSFSKVEKKKEKEIKKTILLDLNSCDSSDLIQLKGIGPVYASRIIKYRRLLGGFVEIGQLKEVYGVSDSLFNKLNPTVYVDTVVQIKRIVINEVALNELMKHPYFRNYNLSRSIINYRKMNGPFENRNDLTKNHLLTDSIIDKITPYILF